MKSLRDGIKTISPPWLQGANGEKLLYSIAIQWDALIDAAVLAVKTRFPSTAPVDGLSLLGQDRGIPRGFSEPKSSYVSRLLRWVDDRRLKGNTLALMRQIQGYLTGYRVTIRVVNQNGAWHSLSADGVWSYYRKTPSNWNWDGDTASWSRFWVVIYNVDGSPWTTSGKWGNGERWGDAGNYGCSITTDQAKTIRSIVKQWTPPHARCEWIIWTNDQSDWNPTQTGANYPDGTWGEWGTVVDGCMVAARDPKARYMRGY